MNLISCDSCAVVLNKDRLNHHMDLYSKDDGKINTEYFMVYEDRYKPFAPCPVCHEPIMLDAD